MARSLCTIVALDDSFKPWTVADLKLCWSWSTCTLHIHDQTLQGIVLCEWYLTAASCITEWAIHLQTKMKFCEYHMPMSTSFWLNKCRIGLQIRIYCFTKITVTVSLFMNIMFSCNLHAFFSRHICSFAINKF